MVIRSSLAPFNCVTVNGVSTMDADPSIVCDVPDGPHARMRAVASVMIVVFVFGVPAAFAGMLYRHRRAMAADQRFKQQGEGDTALTNPHFQVRQRYRKLYEDYKPEFMYWKLVLLVRKMVFAAIAVLLDHHIDTQVRRGREARP